MILFRPLPYSHLHTEPLDCRAWSMQEWDLSNRFLDFRSLQLKWSCQVAGANLEREWLDGWRYEVENNVFQDDVYDVMSSWLKMISTYTSRNLTVATDRILAISGIAEAAGKLIKGEYWAGLWENNVPLCLMWKSRFHTYDKAGKLLEPGKPIPRPAEYQGPSWSWVSVNTKAHYYLFTTRDIDIRFEVLSCDIKLADERAMYGAVKAAKLRIRGRVMPGMLYYSPDVIPRTSHGGRLMWIWQKGMLAPVEMHLNPSSPHSRYRLSEYIY